MSGRTVRVSGLAWDDARGIGAMRATALAYRLVRPDVEVVWDSRPLWQFAYASIGQMLDEYDLALFDHPHVGTMVGGVSPMADLNDLLDPPTLEELRRHSVGPSFRSYEIDGTLRALPVDTAAQMAVCREDLLPQGTELPRTWPAVAELARELPPGRSIALPMNYSDAAANLCSVGATVDADRFYTCAGGFDRDVLAEALGILDGVLAVAHPDTVWAPPVLPLELMVERDEIVYIPLHFAYLNYGRAGFRRRRLAWHPPPGLDGRPARPLLGGVGLAVSSRSPVQHQATEYAAWVASGPVQCGPLFDGGGQPADRRAWLDADLDRVVTGAFSATLDAHDRAWLRPRIGDCPRWWDQQIWVGHLLAETAMRRQPLQGLVDDIIRIDQSPMFRPKPTTKERQ